MRSVPGIVAARLLKYEDSREYAVRLFEQAVSPDQRGYLEIQYSPVIMLVRLYMEMNRNEDARALLLNDLKPLPNISMDPQSLVRIRIENSLAAASLLTDMKMPMDVLRIYHELLTEVDEHGWHQGAATIRVMGSRAISDRASWGSGPLPHHHQ